MKVESNDRAIADRVSEAFRRGSEKSGGANSLYRYFGLTDDPFTIDNVLGKPELVAEKSRRTLSRLAELTGFAAESKTNILLVGPEGAGRSLMLRLLSQTLDQSMGAEFAVYLDAQSLGRPNEEQSVSKARTFKNWSGSIDFEKSRVLLIDNADQSADEALQQLTHLAGISREPPVVLRSISLPAYMYMSTDERVNHMFKVVMLAEQWPRTDIERMLRSSIASCQNASNPFDDATFRLLASYSLGLPGLATDLATACLQFASGIGVSHVGKGLADRVASILHYGRALAIAQGEAKLEGTKAEIALEALREFYLKGEIRRGWIVSEFSDLARSTLAYHLRDLVGSDILLPERLGFRMRYRIARPVRSALQIAGQRWTRVATTDEDKRRVSINAKVGMVGVLGEDDG